MKFIKYLKTKKMIKQIDKDIKVKYGKVLECEPEDGVIYIGFGNTELEDRTFRDYVNELQPNCKYSDFLLGVLHEIGHLYTLDTRDEEPYSRDTELLSMLYSKDMLSEEQMQYFYLRLPMERQATLWALEFARLNPNFCNKWNKKIM